MKNFITLSVLTLVLFSCSSKSNVKYSMLYIPSMEVGKKGQLIILNTNTGDLYEHTHYFEYGSSRESIEKIGMMPRD